MSKIGGGRDTPQRGTCKIHAKASRRNDATIKQDLFEGEFHSPTDNRDPNL